MKKLFVILLWLASLCYIVITTKSASLQEMKDLVARTSYDYQVEQKFDWKCKVGDNEVSLAALSYALLIQEWGWKDWTVGDKTNNWWSLHWTVGIKEIKGKTRADGTNNRPIYNSPYDSIYEKMHLIVTRPLYNWCNFQKKQLRAYIKWPRTPITNDAYMNKMWDNLNKNALAYTDSYKDINKFNKTETKLVQKMHKSECKELQWKYIQFDTLSGEFQDVEPMKYRKTFICN